MFFFPNFVFALIKKQRLEKLTVTVTYNYRWCCDLSKMQPWTLTTEQFSYCLCWLPNGKASSPLQCWTKNSLCLPQHGFLARPSYQSVGRSFEQKSKPTLHWGNRGSRGALSLTLSLRMETSPLNIGCSVVRNDCMKATGWTKMSMRVWFRPKSSGYTKLSCGVIYRKCTDGLKHLDFSSSQFLFRDIVSWHMH